MDLCTRNAGNVLSNFPLAVSIYSSVQTVLEGYSELNSACNKELSFKLWTDVEREFGDHFHARGLREILDIARKSIE